MKKIFSALAASTFIIAVLLPIGVVKAVSYYPGYTCYYRDISGSCLSYQSQRPYLTGASYNPYYRSPYGNRQTYPFNAMFNAYSTNQNPWDNRYNNRYRYSNYRYEEDDDDNDYVDEDDDGYRYYYDDDDDHDGDWRWYLDEDDDTIRPYRYQSDDDYDDGYYYGGRYDDDDGYYEYEHTRVYCTGRDCDTTNYRY